MSKGQRKMKIVEELFAVLLAGRARKNVLFSGIFIAFVSSFALALPFGAAPAQAGSVSVHCAVKTSSRNAHRLTDPLDGWRVTVEYDRRARSGRAAIAYDGHEQGQFLPVNVEVTGRKKVKFDWVDFHSPSEVHKSVGNAFKYELFLNEAKYTFKVYLTTATDSDQIGSGKCEPPRS